MFRRTVALGITLLAVAGLSAGASAKALTAKQIDKIVEQMVSDAGVANGSAGSEAYDPKHFDAKKANAAIKADVSGYAHRGVHFVLEQGAEKALAAWDEYSKQGDSDHVNELARKLVDAGAVQYLVSYHLGDIDDGVDYYSIPWQFDVYVKYPSGAGKRVSIFYEIGD